ncbi:MAG TPA: protoheme IX farnesyltransferase [Deltaproteobacteria bacterium]|nr:MAG: protoheme IX farnesyltransferase [Deltaproteobacteria bacterium GWA2_55_82]OGQ62694.1 MAG: protoheme IX farnesyltransferase [Deltaproteobacteria bacterium RIFCSPLOWO2_02_FULL_55_12]OIJ74286.1 MAG: protoheme IX farnesyltransferase [Deltaproteobacteria bacterium GWC2_55_46]HBG46924.1 protoheme IX farnesyltransferase [Deltaproteobacteria bacterium]HCY11018.1 protoheme IX farnesyltransferase [Deltaproteobacteria bacterium]
MTVMKYLPVFKLRICSLITFSAIVGLISSASGGFSFGKMAFLVLATMLAAASASAFNHYFDSDIDSVMKRTSRRPLPSGVAGSRVVLVMAAALFILSLAVSFTALNYMVALHLALGAFVYAIIYTVWLKRRSWVNIIIGGLAGSFAVLAGGASASPDLCMPPVLLAIVMFFWTPSHFWSFAIYHRDEYAKAGVPMLPVVVGDRRTALYTLINTILLVTSSLVPWVLGYSGVVYLASAVLLGAYFIYWNVRLVRDPAREIAWKNFKVSMLYLGVLFTSVIVDMAVRNMG